MAIRLLLFLLYLPGFAMAQQKQTPDQLFGQLFTDVQDAHIFPDSKFFVDCIPKEDPARIVEAYRAWKEDKSKDHNLAQFVSDHFYPPLDPLSNHPTSEPDVVAHINRLWHLLHRKADTAATGSSLLPLPHDYIVPGGRFREVYYWDSYFTMLGLKESGETAIIENMVKNFAWLIDTYHHIPNGNRSYYLSRSQPPFFSLMVELLAGIRGDSIYTVYLPQLQREWNYWGDRMEATQHAVPVPANVPTHLYRYWDQLDIPRQEAYTEDVHTASSLPPAERPALYRELRSAAESGWDFSSRWFGDGKNLETIRTTHLLPVDLNCLLVHHVQTIAKGLRLKGMADSAKRFDYIADGMAAYIRKHFWSERLGWFMDYDLDAQAVSSEPTLAGLFPFFLGIADKKQMAVAKKELALLQNPAASLLHCAIPASSGIRPTDGHRCNG